MNMKFTFSFFLLYIYVAFSSDAQKQPVLGLAPAFRNKYMFEDGKFQCLDSTQKISESMVNDDYCDCEDGSDEPGTSACPNGHFYCKNRGHHPKTIVSSFVNDGVCDCCDGSDEYLKRISCPNTCMQDGAQVRAKLQKELQEAEKGALKRADMALEAEKTKIEWTQRLEKNREELKTLKPQVDALKTKNAQAQKAAQVARQRKKQSADLASAKQEVEGEGAAAEGESSLEGAVMDETANTQTVDNAGDNQEQQQEGGGSGGAGESEEESEEERGRRIAAQWTTNAEAAGEAGEAAEAAASTSAGESAAGEDDTTGGPEDHHQDDTWEGEEYEAPQKPADWNDEEDGVWEPPDHERDGYESYHDYGAHYDDAYFGSEHEDFIPEGDESETWDRDYESGEDFDNYDLDDDMHGGDDAEDSDVSVKKSGKELGMRIMSAFKRFIHTITFGQWGKEWDFTEEEAETVKREFEAHNGRLAEIEKDISTLEKQLEWDFGPELAFLPLSQRCVEAKVRQYTYKVCPFQSASQIEGHNTVNLGNTFSFQDEYTTMSFTGGQTCWNGPQRSLTVTLVCDSEEKLSKVEEPNRCEYTAVLATPAACSKDHTEFIKNKAESMEVSHDELR